MSAPPRSYAHPPPWHPLWAELCFFLGQDAFRPDWCTDSDEKTFEEARRYPDVGTFYRESQVLCYQGVAYHLAGWKRKYHSVLLQLGMGPLTVLDYGCGNGHDGFTFLEYGYDVTFADRPGWPLAFCRWRLEQRGYEARTLTLGHDTLPGNVNFIWCMDVLEHLPPEEQPQLLETLARLGRVVCTNLIHDVRADGQIHYPVDIDGLTAHVQARWAGMSQDVHKSANGNVTRFLLYGEGVTANADGGITVDVHGQGEGKLC